MGTSAQIRRRDAGVVSGGIKIHLMPTDIAKVVQTNGANLKRFSELFGN
jgi:hypothetical protein